MILLRSREPGKPTALESGGRLRLEAITLREAADRLGLRPYPYRARMIDIGTRHQFIEGRPVAFALRRADRGRA